MRNAVETGGDGNLTISARLLHRSADARQVCRDMEGIFGADAQPHAKDAAIKPDAVKALIADKPAGRRKWLVGAPLLALCGAAVVGGLVWLSVPARETASHDMALSMAAARPLAQRPVPQPQALLAQAPVLPVIASAPSPERPNGKAAAEKSGKSSKVIKAAKPVQRHKVRAAVTGESACSGMSRLERSRCMRPRLLRADEQLRDAYAHAVRAGVDRHTLTAYRNRWSRLLGQSISDPAHVTASLKQMAQQLDAERTEL